jgi:PAS domain S-box-containing protein
MEDVRHFAQVVKSTQDAVLSKDLNGILTSWNPAAARLYGYSEEEPWAGTSRC